MSPPAVSDVHADSNSYSIHAVECSESWRKMSTVPTSASTSESFFWLRPLVSDHQSRIPSGTIHPGDFPGGRMYPFGSAHEGRSRVRWSVDVRSIGGSPFSLWRSREIRSDRSIE
jgi:hypothetical protein